MAFTGLVHARDYGANKTYDVAISPITRGLLSATYNGQAALAGEVFAAWVQQTLGNLATSDIGITTGATALNIVLSFDVSMSALGTLEFRKDSTFTGGTGQQESNFNLGSVNTAEVAIDLDPTVSVPGTTVIPLQQMGYSGQGNTSFGAEGGAAFVLAASSQYLLQLTSLAADNQVGANFVWTETPVIT